MPQWHFEAILHQSSAKVPLILGHVPKHGEKRQKQRVPQGDYCFSKGANFLNF